MNLQKRRLTAVVASLVGVSSAYISLPASAQGENLTVEELIVTARRKDEMLQDVPLSINAFSEEMLDEANINNLQNLADFTPGFDFAQSFGRQDFRPAIRGQSNIQGGANAGLFYDGIYIGRGGPTFPYGAIQSVEVIKGPQSTLYGRSTLAGAVNYSLKKPTAEFEGQAELTVGEDGELRTDLTLSGPITSNIGYMVSASYYEFDGQYRNQYEGETWTQPISGDTVSTPAANNLLGAEETTSFVGLLNWQVNDDFALTGRVIYEDSDDGPYAIGLLSSANNNCFVGETAPTGGEAYNGSGYYCGELDVDDITDEGGPALNNSYYNDMGVRFEALRLSLSAEWYIDEWLLNANLSHHDYTSEAVTDLTFGSVPDRPVDGGGTVGGNVYNLPFGGGATNFGFWADETIETEETALEVRIASPDADALRFMTGFFLYELEEDEKERDSSQARGACGLGVFGPTYDIPVYADDAIEGSCFGSDYGPFVQQDLGTEERFNWAVFGQVEYDITDSWTASLEVRYNVETLEYNGGPNDIDYDNTYRNILPRASLNWFITSDAMAYMVIGKGNKPGNLNTDPDLSNSEREVEEEEAWNYELGAKTTWWDQRITLNGALFYTDWKDQQLTSTVVTEAGDARSILQNVGESEIYGLELEMTARLTNFWDMYLGYAYTDTEIKEFLVAPANNSGYREPGVLGFPYDSDGNVVISGTELPQVSKNQATFSNTLHFNITDSLEWFVRADYLYASKRYAQVYNLAHTGDRHVINMRTGIRHDMFDLEVWVDNLNDDNTSPSLIRYVEVADGNFGPNRAIGATMPRQRTVGITGRIRF